MRTQETTEQNPDTKLYSQLAIAIATFFGAPLAAGILIRRNSINLGREKEGFYALLIGIISTLLIFIGIFSLPEHIIDKIPSSTIPAIYTFIIYLIVEKIQGEELKEHKRNKEPFYSNWRATGIGVICTVIIVGSIFLYVYLIPDNYPEEFNIAMIEFGENENEAIKLFDIIEYQSDDQVVHFIDNKGIPAWERNIAIINSLNQLEDLPEDLKKQNRLLLEYCNLRVEVYELIRKTIEEKSFLYEPKIEEKNRRIDQIIDEL